MINSSRLPMELILAQLAFLSTILAFCAIVNLWISFNSQLRCLTKDLENIEETRAQLNQWTSALSESPRLLDSWLSAGFGCNVLQESTEIFNIYVSRDIPLEGIGLVKTKLIKQMNYSTSVIAANVRHLDQLMELKPDDIVLMWAEMKMKDTDPVMREAAFRISQVLTRKKVSSILAEM